AFERCGARSVGANCPVPQPPVIKERFMSVPDLAVSREAEYSASPAPRARTLPARLVGISYRMQRLAIGAASLSSAFYDWQMRRGGVRAERQRLQLAQYPTSAPPLKVAFLSDLHYGPLTGSVAPAQAWKIAREAQPDLLLLG